MTLVDVRDLRIELDDSHVAVVDGVSFTVDSGEIVALVGESGSGKTTIGNALLGHSRKGCHIAGGTVLVDGIDVRALDDVALQKFRGAVVSYIPQDPTAALNPSMRIGRQLTEMIEAHRLESDDTEARIIASLNDVGLPSDAEFLRRFPHQLSGGQQQRVVIAMAFILRPRLVVMDEPTTGLDVTTQQVVLATVRRLCTEHRAAAIYVTHDVAVVANLADRVMVAYAGRIVETATRQQLFAGAAHPYTRRLLTSIPDARERRSIQPIPGRAPGLGTCAGQCAFASRCGHVADICTDGVPAMVEVEPGHHARCVRIADIGSGTTIEVLDDHPRQESPPILNIRLLNVFHGSKQVLWDVDFSVHSGECLAVVGESGSGKTTLARTIVGLGPTWHGSIDYRGEALKNAARKRPASIRRNVQYIFQSPYNALNPRRTIGDSVALGARLFFSKSTRELAALVEDALEQVSLPPEYAKRYPDQLSGGERQRAAIARALACAPEVLICDEITSALDVSVQASIIALLGQLQREKGLTLLFVTHNLALVRTIADRVMVVKNGRVVESGDVAAVLSEPTQDYTKSLIANTLSIGDLGQPPVVPTPVRAAVPCV